MFEYDEDAKAAAEKLDEYNFIELLRSCYINNLRDPWDIRDKIMDEYTELGLVDSALDYLSNDEFMEYLSERYPIRFEEIIGYRMQYR